MSQLSFFSSDEVAYVLCLFNVLQLFYGFWLHGMYKMNTTFSGGMFLVQLNIVFLYFKVIMMTSQLSHT
jgi:hypothetical protein